MIGFLFIDKPAAMGSFDVVCRLRKKLNERKIGFVGTLDPLATGLLIFALGDATKLIPYLEGLDKTYEVVIRLGAVSNTYDADGEVEVVKGAVEPSLEQIQTAIAEQFSGEQDQMPPAFSALHIDGQRAYDLARKGEKVNLKKRKVMFYDVQVDSYEWPQLRCTIHCGSGTYIRSFAHDLGQKLGCGGYVKALRRTKISHSLVEDAVSLDAALEGVVKVEDFFGDWGRVHVNDDEYALLCNGGWMDSQVQGDGPFLALHLGECVGVLEWHKGQLKFQRKFQKA